MVRSLEDEVRWGEVTQSCPTLCNPMDCSLPGSSIHGIFQARVLEWVAISFSRGSSQPRDQTQVSCIVGRRFTIWATREVFGREGRDNVNCIWPDESHRYEGMKGFPCGASVKNPSANAGDPGSIPACKRCPGEGNGNPLQYCSLGNPMGRGAWWARVHGVTKSQTWLK